MTGGLLANLREGRMQRLLCAATAATALPLGVEVWLEHYRGSFGDRWMWTPIVATPPLVAAGVAGVFSERAARTALPPPEPSTRPTASSVWSPTSAACCESPADCASRSTTWSWARRCWRRARCAWSAGWACWRR